MYLKVENLHCTNGEFSLHDISFEVESGTILAVGGPNGAGKTTLIKCLFGQIKPVSGRILLNGEDIAKKSPREISRHIAVVSQEIPEPFNFTVRDVISISGYSKDKETISIMEALEKCGTPHLLDRQYSELSGGEKRLVMVAAAVYQESSMIIMDEPTAFLDVDKELKVINIIRRLRDEGKTVIVSLHDLNLIYSISDYVILLKNGHLVHSGFTKEVLSEKTLESVYGVKFSQLENAGPYRFYASER